MVLLSSLLKVEFITVKRWILVDANLPCSSMRTDSMSIPKCGSLHRVKKKNAKLFGSFDRPRTKNQQTNRQRQYKQINKNKFECSTGKHFSPGLCYQKAPMSKRMCACAFTLFYFYIFLGIMKQRHRNEDHAGC